MFSSIRTRSKRAVPGSISARQQSKLRQVAIVSVFILVLYCSILLPNESLDTSRSTLAGISPAGHKQLPPDLLESRFLSEKQCAATFPDLTKEIDDVVARGPFQLERSANLGPLVGMIKNNQLFILSYTRKADLSADMLQHRTATLHAIDRALTTSPSPLPDTIFAFNHHDNPLTPTWSYSRPASPTLNPPTARYFPIPHFSFWSWPLPFIGSFSRAADAITALETSLTTTTTSSFESKTPKAVWRGTSHFNNAHAGRLRQDLVAATKDKPWADVEALKWSDNGHNATNALAIEDFCRYRYIIHTEGITYSGRFQFHQQCASVVITPPLAWLQHTTHLARPVLSSSLPGVERTAVADSTGLASTNALDGGGKAGMKPYPAEWVRQAWKEYPADEANIVFVAPDWSDLEATVEWLEKNPRVAEGIARRQREMFADRGYLSPAAEACYWRFLIRGWSKVVRTEGQGFEDMEAIPFEEFVLKEAHR